LKLIFGHAMRWGEPPGSGGTCSVSV
jgi:hypothetical protein